MNLRKAAQQALEALEDSHQNINPERSYAEELTRQISGAITVLRDALAEDRSADTGKTSDHIPDATKMVEPVAWMVYTLDGQSAFITDSPADFTPKHRALPLYTAPPKREPMTDEQVSLYAYNIDSGDWNDLRFRNSWHEGFKEGFRAAEAAHGVGGEE